jgi:hypothetical protein
MLTDWKSVVWVFESARGSYEFNRLETPLITMISLFSHYSPTISNFGYLLTLKTGRLEIERANRRRFPPKERWKQKRRC